MSNETTRALRGIRLGQSGLGAVTRKACSSLSAHSRVALVCDWLTVPGGAEKVLLELHRMYPTAPIYTSQYRPKKINWFQDAIVHTGWLNIFPAFLRRYLGVFRQSYFSHLDLSNYDLVISVTGAEAKSVRTVSRDGSRRATHICYCHVPTQYYWEKYDEYLKHPGFGFMNPIVRFFFRLFVGPLRRADLAASARPDVFLAPSTYAAAAIKKYYHRPAEIVFPPVDLAHFSVPAQRRTSKAPYVISCRQVTWKRVDLAIQACVELSRPLVVIGDGPEHPRLVELARRLDPSSQLITFLPWLSAPDLAVELSRSRAYLFPSTEPFGMAPVEALAAGCPVIAYKEGGSRDIVTPGKNGLLFGAQTSSSLASAIRRFEGLRLSRQSITASAERFNIQHFRDHILEIIGRAGDHHA